MNVYKRYKDIGNRWHETTLDDCIEHTEGSGYYKFDSVENMLELGLIVETPVALYKSEYYKSSKLEEK